MIRGPLGNQGSDNQEDCHNHSQHLHADLPAHIVQNRLEHQRQDQLRHGSAHECQPPHGAVARTDIPFAAGNGGRNPQHTRADTGKHAVCKQIQIEPAGGSHIDHGCQEEPKEAGYRTDRIGRTAAALIHQRAAEKRGNRVNCHHQAVAQGNLHSGPPGIGDDHFLHDGETGAISKQTEHSQPRRNYSAKAIGPCLFRRYGCHSNSSNSLHSLIRVFCRPKGTGIPSARADRNMCFTAFPPSLHRRAPVLHCPPGHSFCW